MKYLKIAALCAIGISLGGLNVPSDSIFGWCIVVCAGILSIK